MLRGMVRLANRAEVVTLAVTAVFAATMLAVLVPLAKTPVSKGFVIVVALGILAAVVVAMCRRLAARCSLLKVGRCPTPFCHGVVQRSDRAPKGYVLCPTCHARWREIDGMQFRTTWQA